MATEEHKIYRKVHFKNLNENPSKSIAIVGKVCKFNRTAGKFYLEIEGSEIEVSNVSKTAKLANGDIGRE